MDQEISELLRAVQAVGRKAFGRNCAIKCPKCQHKRARHKNARPLNVKRTSGGVVYHCWHCGWKGFLPIDGGPAYGSQKKKRDGLKLPAWI